MDPKSFVINRTGDIPCASSKKRLKFIHTVWWTVISWKYAKIAANYYLLFNKKCISYSIF